ncbi:MAG: protein-L-isoaspartate(D-aspartate) O-methyltransferase [Candidatus Aenigmarchaeota archaeon]|nr:protein-L-isoaspartate(D-aspartate) O-methyltransferase [Candidatus Aenigmarchaeota archaeon]
MQSNKALVGFLRKNGYIKTNQIEQAFLDVDRINFVPEIEKNNAYYDYPLPIGFGQTISQPSTIARMTELLQPSKEHEILEIGSGSGYQAAILAEIVRHVDTVERIKKLYDIAKKNLSRYIRSKKVSVFHEDASKGFGNKEYNRIISTAAFNEFPEKLAEHLTEGGIMVVPVGPSQLCEMVVVCRHDSKIEQTFHGYYSFVPILSDIE